MKIVILDAATLGADIDLNKLKINQDCEIEKYESTSPEESIARLKDAEIIIVNKVKLNEKNLNYADKLKLICIAATGFDNVDLEYCKKNNIAVCNVKGYSTESVAQITVSMALYLSSHIKEYSDFVKNGNYTKSQTANRLIPIYHELAGKTWGIIGLGNIGKKVAKIAEAIGCNVIAVKRIPDETYEITDIDTLCKNSDIISIHAPLSEETKNLISKEKINMMKNNAIVINVARGAIADEKALCEAIINKKIAGLGIDVYTKEPFDENSPYNKIKDFDNVCLTPHMAWGAYEARVRLIEKIAENIKSFLDGGTLSRLV